MTLCATNCGTSDVSLWVIMCGSDLELDTLLLETWSCSCPRSCLGTEAGTGSGSGTGSGTGTGTVTGTGSVPVSGLGSLCEFKFKSCAVAGVGFN